MFARVMMQAPTAYKAYGPFVEAIFARLEVPPYDRELAVLYTVHLERGEFEWVQHAHIAPTMMGVPQAQVDAIARDDVTNPIFSEKHQALLAFTRQVVENVRVDDDVFEAMAKHYPMREVVETLFTIGSYMLLARISEVARIPPEPPAMGVASLSGALARVKPTRLAISLTVRRVSRSMLAALSARMRWV
jgi:alkylhydroperoxidase family enzyme